MGDVTRKLENLTAEMLTSLSQVFPPRRRWGKANTAPSEAEPNVQFSPIRGGASLGIGWALAVVALSASVAAQTPAAIKVESPTLKADQTIPTDHTADGKNISPALTWSGAPAATKQFALVCDDPDVPMPGGFVHWVVYKIPGTAKGLPADLPMEATLSAPAEIAGTIQGLSGFKRAGYRGPAPPPGKPHHYTFTVYALDAELPLEPGLSRAQLMEAVKGHIIGQGALVAIYERVAKQ